ncbi:hypothetical protein P9Z80_33295 [Bacillus cereus]|nr:hypothetical protein [Bacillus cereus]MEC3262785.1 hypothetical protein [Bacillus cereus]
MSWKLLLFAMGVITFLHGITWGDLMVQSSIALILLYLSYKEEN